MAFRAIPASIIQAVAGGWRSQAKIIPKRLSGSEAAKNAAGGPTCGSPTFRFRLDAVLDMHANFHKPGQQRCDVRIAATFVPGAPCRVGFLESRAPEIPIAKPESTPRESILGPSIHGSYLSIYARSPRHFERSHSERDADVLEPIERISWQRMKENRNERQEEGRRQEETSREQRGRRWATEERNGQEIERRRERRDQEANCACGRKKERTKRERERRRRRRSVEDRDREKRTDLSDSTGLTTCLPASRYATGWASLRTVSNLR
ncbi:hypothetical protein K0M31_010721 [Melipona bicolor]|uniref:Uncharacterized protein n=1 Tax=Melipona bicolor TaxID=60889 RepID=A0AA40FLN9_9HYME|nr:hypothetical protein K0M31_010721 [Melipona bicolor]